MKVENWCPRSIRILDVAMADRPLSEQLLELQSWLRQLESTNELPAWTHVLIGEDRNVDWTLRPGRLAASALLDPTLFELRWNELIAEGRSDWINVSAQGVWKDALIVLVEAPRFGDVGRYAPDQISVNFSGPYLQSGGDLSAYLLITE
jgi:hypothetical protein